MNEFQHQLRRCGRRIALTDVTAAFYRAHPALVDAPDRRRRLWAALEELAACGFATLPAAKGPHWECLGLPPLPKFITLKAAEKAAPLAFVAWLPELAFAASLPRSKKRDLLARLNAFLIEHPVSEAAALLPYRERAAQIFGQEKALDPYVEGDRAFGALPLAIIGACASKALEGDVVYRTAPRGVGRAGLVIENEHSYTSVRDWNEARPVPRYSFVAYGAGAAILGRAAKLKELVARHETKTIYYIGDLDPNGILIATQLAAKCHTLSNGALAVLPERSAYEWLLAHGTAQELTAGMRQATDVAWLGTLGPQVLALFSAHKRIAQEALNAIDIGQVLAPEGPLGH